MAESLVQVTEGAGKKLHTWSRVISANTVEDEFVVPGEYPLATYSAVAEGVSAATSSDHLLQLMAGASLNVRIRRIRIQQAALITAAQEFSVRLMRLTTAGTGGAAVTPRPMDSADTAAGAAGMTLPTVKGTEGVQLDIGRIYPVQTYSTGGVSLGLRWEWSQLPNGKPIIIPAGTANGLALKVSTGRAGLTVDCIVEFVETSFAG